MFIADLFNFFFLILFIYLFFFFFFHFAATEQKLQHQELADPESIPDSAPPTEVKELNVSKDKNDQK